MIEYNRRVFLGLILSLVCIYFIVYANNVQKEEWKKIIEEAVEKKLKAYNPPPNPNIPSIPPPLPPNPPPTPPSSKETLPWDFSKPFRLDGEACSVIPIMIPSSLLQSKEPLRRYTQCVRRTPDVVSNEIRTIKRWKGCDNPLDLYLKETQKDFSQKDSSIFLDVGANIGSCSLLALSAGATVVAFEPLPSNLFYFHESIASLNPRWKDQITLYPVALGSSKKEETIYTEPGNAGNSALEFPTRARRDNSKVVQVLRLDDILKPPISIAVLKMDVQGYEIHVLEGAKRLLESKSIQIIQTEISTEWLKNLNRLPSQLCALLWKSGYDLFEESCVGRAAYNIQKGRVLTEKKCKEWDTINAECDIVARLKN
jgi:FkbM family methyltransferase